MKKMINKTHVEGLVFENELKLNVAGATAKNPGMEYVNGKITIETGTGDVSNTVTVSIYEGALTSKGAKNGKFETAKSLVNAKSIIADGRENATAVKIDSAISLNEWFKGEELVVTPQNFGGFIHIVNSAVPSATFETDVVIVNTIPETIKKGEEVEETGRLIVNGYIFDFSNKIMPVKFIVANPAGVSFFEGMEPNTFTKIWGTQISSTVKTTRVEESAFGDAKVVESEYSKRELVISGAQKEPYSDELLSIAEIQEALAARNVYLADKKKKDDEYKASRAAGGSTVSGGTAGGNALSGINTEAGFNF